MLAETFPHEIAIEDLQTAIAERIREAEAQNVDEKAALIAMVRGDTLGAVLYGPARRNYYRDQPQVLALPYDLGHIIIAVRHVPDALAGPWTKVLRRKVRVWVTPEFHGFTGRTAPGGVLDLKPESGWVAVLAWERWVGKGAAQVRRLHPITPDPERFLYVPGHWVARVQEEFARVTDRLARKREHEHEQHMQRLAARWFPGVIV